MKRPVIGFNNGEFCNDLQDQADTTTTVTAGPGEVVTIVDGEITITQTGDTTE
ncbi:hypothetical protein WKI65_44525 [Streptomyces sp. MS1.AVA.3]|uniref:hypothetical protein n=1 Tax=Streptomyces decoyicus TaxID=249567 RepID=UPI0030C45098